MAGFEREHIAPPPRLLPPPPPAPRSASDPNRGARHQLALTTRSPAEQPGTTIVSHWNSKGGGAAAHNGPSYAARRLGLATILARRPAGKAQWLFRPPAGSASASCWAATGVDVVVAHISVEPVAEASNCGLVLILVAPRT